MWRYLFFNTNETINQPRMVGIRLLHPAQKPLPTTDLPPGVKRKPGEEGVWYQLSGNNAWVLTICAGLRMC